MFTNVTLDAEDSCLRGNSLECETGASLCCADVTVAPPIQVHTMWRGNNLDVCCGPVGRCANSLQIFAEMFVASVHFAFLLPDITIRKI